MYGRDSGSRSPGAGKEPAKQHVFAATEHLLSWEGVSNQTLAAGRSELLEQAPDRDRSRAIFDRRFVGDRFWGCFQRRRTDVNVSAGNELVAQSSGGGCHMGQRTP